MSGNEPNDNAESPFNRLEIALKKAVTRGTGKRTSDFKEAYPLIEQHLARKVSHKLLLDTFNTAYGHKLYPASFRKMLEVERGLRSGNGDQAQCSACGTILHGADEAGDSNSDVAE